MHMCECGDDSVPSLMVDMTLLGLSLEKVQVALLVMVLGCPNHACYIQPFSLLLTHQPSNHFIVIFSLPMRRFLNCYIKKGSKIEQRNVL